jgi:hypothetical protein
MRKVLEGEGRYFVLEVEDPEFGNNQQEREKRIAFYRKSGAKLIKGLRYELPPLQGATPTEMLLMIFPGDKIQAISAKTIRNLIIQIYRELYDRDAGEMLRRNFQFNPTSDIALD